MPLLPTLWRRASGPLSSWPDWDLLDDRMQGLAGLAPWSADQESLLWAPRVDFAEKNGQYVLTAELPGVEPDDVDVQVEGNVVSIKGEKRSEREQEDERVQVSERRYGSFERSFTLPAAADPEQVDADFRQGVLTVEIGKRPEATGRKIEIRNK